MTDITIHEFPAVIEMQPSPFGLKLETWLRMKGFDYDVEWNPQKMGPKDKVPFATIDGVVIGDSEHIIEKLSKASNIHSTLIDPVQDILVRRLVEEHLYFILVYSRWVDPMGWADFKDLFFAPAPALIRGFIAKKVRKLVVENLRGQGIARHTHKEVYKKGADDLKALSEFLGDKPYFCGDQPGLTDASAYGLLANIHFSPVGGDLPDLLNSHGNLVQFVERMKKQYWPSSRKGGGDEPGFKAQSPADLKVAI